MNKKILRMLFGAKVAEINYLAPYAGEKENPAVWNINKLCEHFLQDRPGTPNIINHFDGLKNSLETFPLITDEQKVLYTKLGEALVFFNVINASI